MTASSFLRSERVGPTLLAAWLARLASCVCLMAMAATVRAEDATEPQFYRGLNLNGPAVRIDGHDWAGQDSPDYVCKDKAFESQQIPLVPETDTERAKMLRSSRWGGNAVTLTNVPSGRYTVFLYVWEDNNPETYSIGVNGREVLKSYRSGTAGQWEKLGPWPVNVRDGQIQITSRGGAANFSGIEVWRGEHDGYETDLAPEAVTFFEKEIRPLLIKRCYECHSADASELGGELRVDVRSGLRRGGATGPAVVPGELDRSLLIKAVRYNDSSLQMPPDDKLPRAEIALLEEWVRRGAPDPRTHARPFVKKSFDLAEARQFWSFRPVQRPEVPAVKNADWAWTDIDRFILAELESRNLTPVGLADRRTLLRRAAFDLTGLPPTPEDLENFESDRSPDAFARAVDRLLESPQYGERWGRHWMDLVRYADTAGDNSDYPVPQLYRYRNYIIDSFNADKPYDEFLREQIAGDLLPADSDAKRNEQIIATGYIASARRFGSIIKDYPQHLTIEDTLDNIGRTVLGLTITCARCHDHKFDPISQEDYYGLYGIFESTRYPFPGIELDKKPRDFVPLLKDGQPGDELAYAVIDGTAGDAALQIRGEPTKPGAVIPRKFLDVLGGETLPDEAKAGSGRLQFANWLTDPRNPLTARVMVNRIWQQQFGAGLVKTPSDFGSRGQPPTHPALLDDLAQTFMDDGWSIKSLHRRIMRSRVYQLSSRDDQRNLAADPSNDWHWRFSRRRLDAESLRDTLLYLSGDLDPSPMTEPHPFPPVDKWQFTQHHPFREKYDSRRRSVYLMTARLNALPFFTTFDGADRNASTPKRDASVTTIQSLYLLNDEFVHDQAEKFARRLIESEPNPDQRLTTAFEMTIARPPTSDELSAGRDYLRELGDRMQSSGTAEREREQQVWASFARVLFRINEFLYVD